MHENVQPFDEAIKGRAGDDNYMTWTRQSAPESQSAITDAYVGIGPESAPRWLRFGAAWQDFLRSHDRPVLHDRDQSHPTLAGSCLAACVFFAVLMMESPVGIDIEVPGLDRDEMVLFQKPLGKRAI